MTSDGAVYEVLSSPLVPVLRQRSKLELQIQCHWHVGTS